METKYIKVKGNEVLGVSDTKISDPEIYKEIILDAENKEKFLKILDCLSKNKTPIIDDNFNIIEEKSKYWMGLPLDKVKPEDLEELQETQKIINKFITPDVYVYYIEYFNILFELSNKGFFITDENKEEKYLEILETEDDYLIDLLEEFLILKDQLSALKTARKTFLNVIERLREVSENDTEELDKIEQLVR
jgi:hypothetical protein